MSERKAIVTNTISQVLVRIIGLGIAIVSVKLLTSNLGTAGMGQYNTIATYLGFCVILADLGLFSTSVREITRHPEKEAQIMRNLLYLRLITAVLATLVAAGAIFLTDYSATVKQATVITSGFIFFNLLSGIFDVTLQTRLKMQFSALAEFAAKLLGLLLLWVLVRADASFLLIAATLPIGAGLITLAKWIAARRFFSTRQGTSIDRDLLRWMLITTIPLGMVYAINSIFFKIDNLLVSSIQGDSAAGIYAVAYKVLEVSLFIGSYFASALKPSLSRSVGTNPKEAGKTVEFGIVVMLVLATPITIASLVFAPEIISLLSDASFSTGAAALSVLGAVLPLLYLDMLLGEILVAADARKQLLIVAGSMLAINLTLNLLIIPRYSFIGAAWVTLTCEALLVIINLVLTRKYAVYRLPFAAIAGIISAAALMYASAHYLQPTSLHFILILILATAVYAAALVGFRVINLRNIKNLLTKQPVVS